jgi:subtilisin-like proprotein convertase family protein
MEISNDDWPPASQLPQFWEDNRESMLAYFERVHEGVRGVVTDAASGAPVAAEVRIDSNPYPTYADPDVGDYHRLVLPGSYSIEISAVGYETRTIPVVVTEGPAVRYDVALQPLATDLQPVDQRVEDGPGGDGWLDPGETADLAVTLRNLGGTASQVSARLEPTGWYARVTRADAVFPDIAAGQSAESAPPHFEVEIDPSVPEGHRVGFALRWQTADAAGTSEPFFLGWCRTVTAGDVPLSIIDHQTTTSELPVSAGITLTGVRVPVDIRHTYIGDLVVELTSPSSTSVVLHDRSGGPRSDIVGTYGDDLTPAQPLSVLVGEPSDGTWRLTVNDQASGDQGTLESWRLELCEEPVEASTPEMRFRDLAVDPGGVLLEWWTYPGLTRYKVYRATDTNPYSAECFSDVTGEDGDDTDTLFLDSSTAPLVFYLVTGVGPQGEGPKGHYGE